MPTLEAPKFEKKPEPEKAETEAKYHFEEIAELEKPMISLAEQLKEAIDKGEYDALISDDAGGRIPTLIMREIMAGRMRKAHPDFTPEQERESLKTYFVAGGQNNPNADVLKKFFKETKGKIKKKALLVTEFMFSGKSIYRLGVLLENAGINFDVASAITDDPSERHRSLSEYDLYKKHNLYVGAENFRRDLRIYDRRKSLGGIYKISLEQESAHPHIWPENRESEDIQIVADARQDVKLMAKRILEKVWPLDSAQGKGNS